MTDRQINAYRIAVVALCVIINTIDGFDVLAMTFISTVVEREWHLTKGELGFLLSSGLLGIGLGALVFSFVTDALGRRPVILGGSVLILIGMIGAATAQSATQLGLWRLLNGLGIGCMVATAGTLAIEYSSRRWRTFSVALVVLGTPIGGTLGGPVVEWLLEAHSWRYVFWFGALLSIVFFPVLVWRLPESLDYLRDRQPKNALQKLNKYGARLGLARLDALPPRPPASLQGGGFAELWRQPLLKTSLYLCFAYFCYMFSFYFIQSWATNLVTDLGLSNSAGVRTSTLISVAGIFGGVTTGYLATRWPLPRMLLVLMLCISVAIATFGFLPPSLFWVYTASIILGFVMWGTSAIVYSAYALSYPVRVRASGIGLVVSAGRAGSIISPIVAGRLQDMGMVRSDLTLYLAIPAAIAAIMFAFSKPESPREW